MQATATRDTLGQASAHQPLGTHPYGVLGVDGIDGTCAHASHVLSHVVKRFHRDPAADGVLVRLPFVTSGLRMQLTGGSRRITLEKIRVAHQRSTLARAADRTMRRARLRRRHPTPCAWRPECRGVVARSCALLLRAFLEAVALAPLAPLVLVHLPAALLHDAIEGKLLAQRHSFAQIAQVVGLCVVVHVSLRHKCRCCIWQDSPWLAIDPELWLMPT